MTSKQEYLLETIKKMTRTYKSRLVTIQQIWYHIEMEAKREVDKSQIVVTLAELIEAGLVQKEIHMMGTSADAPKVETPLFYAF